MTTLRALPLMSTTTIGVALVLAALAVLLAAWRLPHTAGPAPTSSPRPTWQAHSAARLCKRLPLVALPVLLVLLSGALLVNRSGQYLRTLGDLVDATKPGAASQVVPLADAARLDAVPTEQWRATFRDDGSGKLTTTWRGPVSGVTQPVSVIVPAGYRPDDGRAYAVVEALHGFPGSPQATLSALGGAKVLQEAIDSGAIPPTILVAPGLNPDGREHDCADLAGRPAVGTWAGEELRRMIATTFPNVSRDRAAWMVMGVSSGGYCAAWLGLNVPGGYGAVGVMSSYDRPLEGGLAHSGDALALEMTLSRMLAARAPDGLRVYALGAHDDPFGAAHTAWSLEGAVQAPDQAVADTPTSGGHAWPLWGQRMPVLLRWWGQDREVWEAVGLPAPTASSAGGGVAATGMSVPGISTTPVGQRDTASLARALRPGPFMPRGLGTMVLAALVPVIAAVAVLRWGPRWRRREAVGAGVGGLRAATAGLGWFLVRLAAVVVLAVLVAVGVGLELNAAGGFYTSWHDVGTLLRGVGG